MKAIALSRTTSKNTAYKDLLIRLAWLAIVLPSIVFSLVTTQSTISTSELVVSKWVYGYINFGSFIAGVVAAILIFWRKSRDWLAVIVSLLLVMWTSTSSGYDFWVLTGIGGADWNVFIAYFMSVPYSLLLSTLVLCVLLTFPDGKWTPGWTRWFFRLALVGTLLTPVYLCVVFFLAVMGTMSESFLGSDAFFQISFVTLPELFRLGVLVLGAFMQVYRLTITKDPVQRQQIKWVVFSLVAMTIFYVLYNAAVVVFNYTGESTTAITLFLFLLIFTYAFIATFVISIFRYRLWDMDLVVNKALVYSSLTAILGGLGLAGAILFDYYAKLYMEESSPILAIFVILPLVVLFVPLRDALQGFVDRHFKPEEIDFSGTIVELSPDAQLMLSFRDILHILTKQAIEQLAVTSAVIYLKHETGALRSVVSYPVDTPTEEINLDTRARQQIEKGLAVLPPESSNFSLYVPLLVSRASKHDFLGVLALGPRQTGAGYSTSVIKSLQKFGADAGKVIYIARLRESTGQNILERLASIEKGLASMKTDLA